jgi:alpha-ketoglutarate-dependent 2,4-dichlorophenoxyacetate dioxygenase
MPVAIELISDTFAGEAAGVDCARPLDRADIRAIDAAMERHAGALMPTEDRIWLFKLADRPWHSDSSFRPIPAGYSLLSGRKIPSSGGETEFADMRAAYDALDEATKREVEDLVCEHSLIYSRETIGFFDLTAEEREHFRPVRHRLVCIDPHSGRRSLFLSAHAGAIVGWTVPEARVFLRDLTEHATQPRFVYRHRWKERDLVMWDNHRARRFDRTEIRDVRRTTIGATSSPHRLHNKTGSS